jgi:hypothetical protein
VVITERQQLVCHGKTLAYEAWNLTSGISRIILIQILVYDTVDKDFTNPELVKNLPASLLPIFLRGFDNRGKKPEGLFWVLLHYGHN